MFVGYVDSFSVFYDAVTKSQKSKFPVPLFCYPRSNFSVVNVYFVVDCHFVIEIVIETDFFVCEAYLYNVSFVENFWLRCLDSDFGTFDVDY